jgi:hypothetical protein
VRPTKVPVDYLALKGGPLTFLVASLLKCHKFIDTGHGSGYAAGVGERPYEDNQFRRIAADRLVRLEGT